MKAIESETSFFSFEVNFWFILLMIIFLFILYKFFDLLKRVNKSKIRIDKLEEKIEHHKWDISSLKNEIEIVAKTINTKTQSQPNTRKEVIVPKGQPLLDVKTEPIDLTIQPPVKINEPKEETIEPAIIIQEKIFFMPAPSSEGDFDISNSSDIFKETVTLYKFFIHKNNPEKADFEFYSDAIGIKNAVNYPDKYLESVCNIYSGYNPNTKKIITETKGTAQKNGDKWVVNSKAKIKYE
ncbi:hypothetical protein [Flavobacterium sp. WC2430]|uniref:hypothetical protein n=1 Tax=Flavobacterium sp. WC2430 TaxID=3234137 RepID=UPI003467E223